MANEATPQQKLQNFVDGALSDPALVLEARVQLFFADLAKSIITPHVGDQYRDTMRNLLLRATEAGLYDPELK